MPDYGRPLQFGNFMTPNAADPAALVAQAQEVEALGLDLIGIQDHPYQYRFLDTWTLLAFLAAKTTRVRLFPDVINLPLRPPAVLAKSAASLDVLSGGRFELGLGAGAFWEGIAAMGGPKREPGEAVTALEEAIDITRLIWSGERGVKYDGDFYELKGVHTGPKPAHDMGIWLGAYGPRMLDLLGRKADGWVPSLSYAPLPKLRKMSAVLDEATVAAGRNPGDIQRVLNINGTITDGVSDGLLNGPVGQWADELTEMALDIGIDTFVYGHDEFDQVRRFAAEVAPLVREQVAAARVA